jgi:putative FmdB family regulatory protein
MPLYEYACASCGERFEEFVVRDSEAVTCRRCGSAGVRKLLSAFAVAGRRSGAAARAAEAAAGGCGSCGDPRGPGSCGSD